MWRSIESIHTNSKIVFEKFCSNGLPESKIYDLGSIGDKIFAATDKGLYKHTYNNTSFVEPNILSLKNNIYPNPFNQLLIANYELRVPGHVSLKLYDLLGNECAVLVDEFQEARRHELRFDGSELAPGMYFYVLHAEERVESGKIVHVK